MFVCATKGASTNNIKKAPFWAELGFYNLVLGGDTLGDRGHSHKFGNYTHVLILVLGGDTLGESKKLAEILPVERS